MTGHRLSRPLRGVRHLVLGLGTVVMLAPFVVMVATSLKPKEEIYSPEFQLLPHRLGAAENYHEALTQVPLLHFLLNGIIVTAAIFALQVLVNVPAAYALAKLRFRGRTTLFAAVLVCLLIPYQATALPIYILFYWLGLLNSYAALVLPFTISVFGIFLMRQFFLGVPDDLVDAARIDGMSEYSIVWSVMAPAAIPALVAFGIFSVVAHWNDYFWPLIAVGEQGLYTPPLGIAHLKLNGEGTAFGPLMAAATIVIAPLVIAFLVAQRCFVEGVVFTGMKG
ncbi:MAG: carbohydrate ABC transporter permease [Reyranella sp.]|uniref:carbohydrate ABC transporter permease n=1 Tax=Reyranella sp. TaxID=1929291 RepID=UPI003D13B9B0